MSRFVLFGFLLATLFFAFPATPEFDLLIVGGRIMDGSGNPWFYGDIGITDGRILRVGRLQQASAKKRIDVRGKVVAPGFIDIHSHGDDAFGYEGLRSEDRRRRAAPNLVSQGVTTLVSNQDGRSPWPIAEQKRLIEENGVGPNVVLLIGHGTIRSLVMKDDYRRPARTEEIQEMRELVRQGMKEGASGLSAGLEYRPGRWSATEELVALVEEIVPWRGVYVSHQRSEGEDPMWYTPSQHEERPPSLLDAVRETIQIGRKTGAVVVASHIKTKGANYWQTAAAAVRLIEKARAEGISIYADQYPYDTTGSDGNTVLIPRWVFRNSTRGSEFMAADDPSGGRAFDEALKEALEDPQLTRRVRMDIGHEIARRGGADRILVFEYPNEAYIGRSLASLAEEAGVSPIDMAIRLQLEGFADRPGGARLRGFSLAEDDIETYLMQPWTMTASDAGITLPGEGSVHPRFYGTFPRKIRRYALERGVVTVEDAIRSMTSLPAQVLGIRDRGLVREGMMADLVVLDLEQLRDKATFFKPHQYSYGVEYVILGGQFLVEDKELTWLLPGQVLRAGEPRKQGD